MTQDKLNADTHSQPNYCYNESGINLHASFQPLLAVNNKLLLFTHFIQENSLNLCISLSIVMLTIL